jgi:hypothetical protein
MNARLRAAGLLGKVLDVGAEGYLSVAGRTVSWTEGGNVRWAVDAAEVEVEQAPTLLRYDLVLRVHGRRWRFVVDRVTIRTFSRGLLVAARRRDAATAMAHRIVEATSPP